jgi:hypothetical protein
MVRVVALFVMVVDMYGPLDHGVVTVHAYVSGSCSSGSRRSALKLLLMFRDRHKIQSIDSKESTSEQNQSFEIHTSIDSSPERSLVLERVDSIRHGLL